jgi:dodecanoy-ACP synthase
VTGPAAITGMGCVTGFGAGVEQTWQCLLKGESAARERPRRGLNGTRCFLTTEGPDAACLEQMVPGLRYPRPARTTLLAKVASREAWQMANLDAGSKADRMGLIISRNFGQQQVVDRYYETLWDKGPTAVSGLLFVQSIANAVLGRIALDFGLRGPSVLNFGAPALGLALDLIRDDRADAILVGCLDELSDYALTLCNAHGLTPASAEGPPEARPYDRSRAGLVPGDGAVFFVLERPEFAASRGAHILGYLRGAASVMDRRSMTNPLERSHEDIAESIARALADAGIGRRDVMCVSGAAAGIRHYDEAEIEAIARTFAPAPPVFSVKGALGETWGAAAGLAFLAAILATTQGVLPPTAGTREVEPGWDVPVVTNSPANVSGSAALALGMDMTGQDSAYIFAKQP